MQMYVSVLLFNFVIAMSRTIEEKINFRTGKDSYLDAHAESHGGDNNFNKINANQGGFLYSQAYDPSPSLSSYGPLLKTNHEIPYSLIGIWDKFDFKLDTITFFKILLKVVIFKKLVSFIAIICLLLFIPWLQGRHDHHDDDDDEEDFRMKNISSGEERLDSLTAYIWEAIERHAN